MPSSTRRASDRRFYEGSSASDSEQSPDPQFELPRRERRQSRSRTKSSGRRQQSRSPSRSRGGTIREERVLGSGRSRGGYGRIDVPPPTRQDRHSSHAASLHPQSEFDFTEDNQGRGGGGRRTGHIGGGREGRDGGGWWDKSVVIGGKSASYRTLVFVGVVSPARLLLWRREGSLANRLAAFPVSRGRGGCHCRCSGLDEPEAGRVKLIVKRRNAPHGSSSVLLSDTLGSESVVQQSYAPLPRVQVDPCRCFRPT